MNVNELIKMLQAVPQDAEAVTNTPLGLTSVMGVKTFTHKSDFGDTAMVMLENGTYPSGLRTNEQGGYYYENE